MGVFSYTFVYKGEIVKKGETPVKYFTKVESSLEGHTLYCDGYAVLDTMYPMISDDDLKQGYVDLKKILNLIEDSPELRKEWGSYVLFLILPYNVNNSYQLLTLF